jgi:hypothetical protein
LLQAGFSPVAVLYNLSVFAVDEARLEKLMKAGGVFLKAKVRI